MTPAAVFHRFIPGTAADSVPVVLLHGSGGDEQDLVPLAAEVAPGAAMIALRGTVSIDGGFAFFHRRPDRSVDEADLAARLPALAACIAAASARHAFSGSPAVIGFSNGAIMAAALVQAHPGLFRAAVLLRPLPPFRDGRPVRLNGLPVLIVDGAKDSRRSPGDGARLAEQLNSGGAAVMHHVLPVGHAITEQDKRIARDFLAGRTS